MEETQFLLPVKHNSDLQEVTKKQPPTTTLANRINQLCGKFKIEEIKTRARNSHAPPESCNISKNGVVSS